MQYMVAFQTYGGSLVILSGWDALSRLKTIRYKRALKVVRTMKLNGTGGDNIRKANLDLQYLAEPCAASQVGLGTRYMPGKIDGNDTKKGQTDLCRIVTTAHELHLAKTTNRTGDDYFCEVNGTSGP
jgi:hypothetical protein